jgi:hypothetical protein
VGGGPLYPESTIGFRRPAHPLIIFLKKEKPRNFRIFRSKIMELIYKEKKHANAYMKSVP